MASTGSTTGVISPSKVLAHFDRGIADETHGTQKLLLRDAKGRRPAAKLANVADVNALRVRRPDSACRSHFSLLPAEWQAAAVAPGGDAACRAPACLLPRQVGLDRGC